MFREWTKPLKQFKPTLSLPGLFKSPSPQLRLVPTLKPTKRRDKAATKLAGDNSFNSIRAISGRTFLAIDRSLHRSSGYRSFQTISPNSFSSKTCFKRLPRLQPRFCHYELTNQTRPSARSCRNSTKRMRLVKRPGRANVYKPVKAPSNEPPSSLSKVFHFLECQKRNPAPPKAIDQWKERRKPLNFFYWRSSTKKKSESCKNEGKTDSRQFLSYVRLSFKNITARELKSSFDEKSLLWLEKINQSPSLSIIWGKKQQHIEQTWLNLILTSFLLSQWIRSKQGLLNAKLLKMWSFVWLDVSALEL